MICLNFVHSLYIHSSLISPSPHFLLHDLNPTVCLLSIMIFISIFYIITLYFIVAYSNCSHSLFLKAQYCLTYVFYSFASFINAWLNLNLLIDNLHSFFNSYCLMHFIFFILIHLLIVIFFKGFPTKNLDFEVEFYVNDRKNEW